MKRICVVFRINSGLRTLTSLFFSAFLIASLSCLNSCNSSGGKYKFQAESMHWLQFRGPQSSGIAPDDANPPIHFSADTNLLWKTEILPGWSSPCIVNDRIFLTGFNDADSLLYTFAINRENGEILWRDSITPNGFYSMHSINSYANPTIASDGKRIFAEFMNYGMICYDLEGNKIWEYPHEMVADFYGGACSPVIADSIVVFKVDPEEDCRIMALDCESGDSIWVIRAHELDLNYFGSNSTIVILNDMMILHVSRNLLVVDIPELSVIWRIPIPGNGVATPVIMDETIFINSYVQLGEEKAIGDNRPFKELVAEIDNNSNGLIEQDEFPDDMLLFSRPEIIDMDRSSMYLKDDRTFPYIDVNEDGSVDEKEWIELWEMMKGFMQEHGMMAVSLEGSGERSFEDFKWKVNEDTPETPSPLVVEEDVFFIKNGGIATVIQRDSGEVVLHERLGAPGAYVSSPMLAGNRIYTSSFNGTVTVISAEDYSVLAQNKLNEKIGASPAAVDDILYVRTDKHLYAFR
ncbi:PQQ-binding-like beta-propeller repeat protein [Bacteroidota bacterium]